MASGRRKFSTRSRVRAGEELFAAPVRSSASVMTLIAMSIGPRASRAESSTSLVERFARLAYALLGTSDVIGPDKGAPIAIRPLSAWLVNGGIVLATDCVGIATEANRATLSGRCLRLRHGASRVKFSPKSTNGAFRLRWWYKGLDRCGQ